jgi:hypothetical protein
MLVCGFEWKKCHNFFQTLGRRAPWSSPLHKGSNPSGSKGGTIIFYSRTYIVTYCYILLHRQNAKEWALLFRANVYEKKKEPFFVDCVLSGKGPSSNEMKKEGMRGSRAIKWRENKQSSQKRSWIIISTPGQTYGTKGRPPGVKVWKQHQYHCSLCK